MNFDSEGRIIFSDTPYGKVPVKIGTLSGLFPEYKHLYFQKAGYQYPWSWGAHITWIHVIRWNTGDTEVWSDKHPDDPSWSTYVSNFDVHLRAGNVNYFTTINNYSGFKQPVNHSVTFISSNLLTEISNTLYSRWGAREVSAYVAGEVPYTRIGENRYPLDEVRILGPNRTTTGFNPINNSLFTYRRMVQFNCFCTSLNSQTAYSSQMNYVPRANCCLWLNSLNPEGTLNCNWIGWPADEMFRRFQLSSDIFDTQQDLWIPNPPMQSGNVAVYTASLSIEDLVNWLQSYGIADTSPLDFPQTRFHNLDLDIQNFPPGVTGPVPPTGPQPEPEPEPEPEPPAGNGVTTPTTPETPPTTTITTTTEETVDTAVSPPYEMIPGDEPQIPITNDSGNVRDNSGLVPTDNISLTGEVGPMPEDIQDIPTTDLSDQSDITEPISEATQDAANQINSIPTQSDNLTMGWVEERSVIDTEMSTDDVFNPNDIDWNPPPATMKELPTWDSDLPPSDLGPLPPLSDTVVMFEQIYYPLGDPNWSTHFKYLGEATSNGPYNPLGSPDWGSQFSPTLQIPWFKRK